VKIASKKHAFNAEVSDYSFVALRRLLECEQQREAGDSI
jgi:hypothetical protein